MLLVLTCVGFTCLQWLVIENLTHPFLKPNVLDIKLGTILHDEFASPDKKERMQRKARETTSGETGVRLTGFQVRRIPVHTSILRRF